LRRSGRPLTRSWKRKVCLCCGSLVARAVQVIVGKDEEGKQVTQAQEVGRCPVCGAYRFEEDPEEVRFAAIDLSTRGIADRLAYLPRQITMVVD